MKVKKILNRLASSPKNPTELSRVGRALANELHRHRLDVLRDFRAGLASIRLEPETFAAGYVASMLDVTAEFEVYLRQVDDEQNIAQTALREDWRDVLEQLADGAKLPSDLATRLGKDRPTVTRVLKRMRTAGLVESFAADSLDGRMRPHRLTVYGRRLLDLLARQHASGRHLSPDLTRGIALAVALFRQLGQKPASTLAELDNAAKTLLTDERQAEEAVRVWTEESRRVGLITRADTEPGQAADPDIAQPPVVADPALWERIPAILSALHEYRDRDTAIYVRTNDAALGAWAYALGQDDTTGHSRTIVRGDILTRSVTPPDRRFALVYDDPGAIDADLREPAMREFLERADGKFVIASADDEVPEGFIQLSPGASSGAAAGESGSYEGVTPRPLAKDE